MSSYKVGDVAALFPKPSVPQTETGKKIKSLFDEFYKNSKKSKTQFQSKKKQVANIGNKSSDAEIQSFTKMKRKFSDTNDSTPNSKDVISHPRKPKKLKNYVESNDVSVPDNSSSKLEMDGENYFPRNKAKFHSKNDNSNKNYSLNFSQEHQNGIRNDTSSVASGNEHIENKKKKNKRKFVEIAATDDAETHEKGQKKMKHLKKSQQENTVIDESEAAYVACEMLDIKHSPSKKKKNNKEQAFGENMVVKFNSSNKQSSKKQTKKGKVKMDKIPDENSVLKQNSSDIENHETTNLSDKMLNAKLSSKKQKIKKRKKDKTAQKNVDNSLNFKNHEHQIENEEPRDSIKFQFQKVRKAINLENAFEEGIKLPKKTEDAPEKLSRTLFVGNLPMSMTKKGLAKLFSPFGTMETCRLRGAVPTKITVSKKIASIKNKFHRGQKSHKGYVVFKQEKDALAALTLNGTIVDDHHIVVNQASVSGGKLKYDEKRSIFIGNLPFDVEDEAVWATFSQCGEIEAVRIIRDRDTGVGKGFGYVLFRKIQSKENALAMNNVEISDRRIRIKSIESKSGKIAPKAPVVYNYENALKRKALKLKGKQENSRKSLKKIMKKEKLQHQKKKIASIFKKFSK